MTRREMIGGIVGIIAAHRAPAVCLNLRGGMMARRGGWKNPYGTDGLELMFDAEWNAGVGIHDSNPRMVDLVHGNVTLDFSGIATVQDLSFLLQGTKTFPDITRTWSETPDITLEIVFKCIGGEWQEIHYYVGGSDLRLAYYGSTIWTYLTGVLNLNDRPSGTNVYNRNFFSLAATCGSNALGAWRIYRNDVVSTEPGYGYMPIAGTPSGLFKIASNNTSELSAIRLYSRKNTAEQQLANYAIDVERFNLA